MMHGRFNSVVWFVFESRDANSLKACEWISKSKCPQSKHQKANRLLSTRKIPGWERWVWAELLGSGMGDSGPNFCIGRRACGENTSLCLMCQNDWQFKDLIYKKWVEKVPFTPGLVCLNGCLCWLKFSVFRGGGMWCNAFFGTLKYPAQTTLLHGRSVCTLLLCFRNPAIKASKNAIKFKLLAQLCKFLWAIVQRKNSKKTGKFHGERVLEPQEDSRDNATISQHWLSSSKQADIRGWKTLFLSGYETSKPHSCHTIWKDI